jgi:FkbM family methyltransferase
MKEFLKKIFLQSPWVRLDVNIDIESHGTSYGEWVLKKNSLTSTSIVFSFGVGEDISFDYSLIHKYCLKIHAFDPTPRVINWISKSVQYNSNFIFYPYGLFIEDTILNFTLPSDSSHVSLHLSNNNAPSDNQSSLEVRHLKSILNELKLSKIDLMKIDIEGSEFPVINYLIENKIYINQLLVEFHHGLYGYTLADTYKAIKVLRSLGYKLFYISKNTREFSFILDK